ncbi:hypothetical protein CNMCM8694_009355 [Aspergillus lentulus]|nr:hypothetical protein CNMCM8060_008283 [Aspergillus lentulus]KAF4193061.1 hypothetical protein CNMCM8694_009355 [Aspergillus lentulus]
MNPAPTQTTDSWEEAVTKYVKSLDPDKQREFQVPATVEACLQGTIDVIVQVNAGIASPIWGPLRMAFTPHKIACQHISALERLAFIVDKIAQSVQRYQDLAALFASHAGVREAVGRLYCELLRLRTCMVKYQTRRLRYVMNAFGKQFASISESVDYRAAEIDRAAQTTHFLEANFLLQEKDRLPSQIMDIVLQYVNDGASVFDTPGLAKRLAGPLVDVRRTITGYEVAALHQSFYQYLSKGSLWTKSDILLQPLRTRKLSRGIAAVWYFTEFPESQQHLDQLRSASSAPIGFYKYESHFPFHYSLLQALKCTEFCSDELCKEDLMVQQLTEFLTSGKCLRWFKLVTMIHFAGNFSKILDNVLGAVAKLSDILSNGSCGSPALAAFNEHRVAFFKN